MKTLRAPVFAFACFLMPLLAGAAGPDFSQTVRDFSADRYKLIQELSARLNLPLPPEAEAFFQAALADDWTAASNRFAELKSDDACQTRRPALTNELWAPVHETWGLYEVWAGLQEDSELLAAFTGPILDSLPAGSIYFGGTDAGRFAVTAVNALKDPPPAFCLTQNGLADNAYMAYLRATCGDRIWLPAQEDSNSAFKQYVGDVKAGRIPAGADVKIEDGKVSVQGVAGVMQINGLLARMIFDRNKDAHPIFVEESFVLGWMYPYLEPRGLILKLNPEPLAALPPETVAADQRFWAETEAKLMAMPGFAGNYAARKIFSKLRAAGAGVYEYRKLDAEAEAAFRQAIRLCPISPEANFRLADMLAARQRSNEAVQVMEDYLSAKPDPDPAARAKEYLQQLKNALKQNNRPEGADKPLPAAPST